MVTALGVDINKIWALVAIATFGAGMLAYVVDIRHDVDVTLDIISEQKSIVEKTLENYYDIKFLKQRAIEDRESSKDLRNAVLEIRDLVDEIYRRESRAIGGMVTPKGK